MFTENDFEIISHTIVSLQPKRAAVDALCDKKLICVWQM